MELEVLEVPKPSTYSGPHSNIPLSLRRALYTSIRNKAKKFQFKRTRGKIVDSRDRQWILRLYYYLQGQRTYFGASENAMYDLLAGIASCSVRTVQSIIESDEIRPNDKRGKRISKKIPEDQEEEIKDELIETLRESLANGVPLSTKDIRSWMMTHQNIEVGHHTMRNYLHSWGINWKRLKVEEFRKAKESVLLQKIEFLQTLAGLFVECNHVGDCECPKERPIVFLDESYVNEHHVSNYGLTIENEPLQKPLGKGRRVVMAAAFTKDGLLGANTQLKQWKPNKEGIYCNGSIRYWTAQIGGDYHHNFHAELFLEYFENAVLAYLSEPSIIILDRAPYHTMYSQDFFYPAKAKKEELRDWLDANNIDYNLNALKDELKTLVLCHWEPPETTSIISMMAKDHGLKHFGQEHLVIFTPPYHPEYNAIEMIWARVKHYVAHYPPYDLHVLLEETLPNAFKQITADTYNNTYKHVFDKIMDDAKQDWTIDEIELGMEDEDEDDEDEDV